MERIWATMEQHGIDQWGVCNFAQTLPLLDVRAKSRVPQDAQSVIVLLIGYYTGDYTERNISRYAIVDDYHTVMRQKLDQLTQILSDEFPSDKFIPFVDASPIPEVRAAHLAGLGDIGMNGQLLNPVYGSLCFIGEIVTTLALAPTAQKPPPLCTHCGRCLAACPTGALTENGFTKERCRSHITQKKGVLTDWETMQIKQGGFVWGCDLCTDACPVNQNARPSREPAFYRDIVPVVGEDNSSRLCQTKAYGWRGENVLMRNLRIINEIG